MDLSGEFMQHQAAIMEVGKVAADRGYPSFFGGVMAQAPYDYFADMSAAPAASPWIYIVSRKNCWKPSMPTWILRSKQPSKISR